MKSVNDEAVKKVLNYIRDSKDYSISSYMKSQNLWDKEEIASSGNVKVSCPFHKDKTPSLFVNDEEDVWHCFSCGRGGSYVKLVTSYNREILKISGGFYQVLDNLLKSDRRMQLGTGHVTIFVKESNEDFSSFKKRRFVKKEESIDSLLELSTKMKKEKIDSLDKIKTAILYAEDGYSPQDIYRILKGGKSREVLTVNKMEEFDINKILEGMDF